ncbi:unnamed protein product, partial [Allacma fusca]
MLVTIQSSEREKMRKLIGDIVLSYMGGAGEDDVWTIVKSSNNLQKFLEEHIPEKVLIEEISQNEKHEVPHDGLCEKLEELNIQEKEDSNPEDDT